MTRSSPQARPARLLSVLLMAALLVSALAPLAIAQPLDLLRRLGEQTEQAQPPPEPLQSRRQAAAGERPPDFEAYGTLTGRETGTMRSVGETVDIFRERLQRLFARMPDALSEITTTLRAASPNGRASYFVGVAIFAALLLVIGGGVGELFSSYVARPLFVAMQTARPEGYAEKLPVLLWRIVLSAVSTAISLSVAGMIGLYFYDGHDATLLTVIAVFLCWGVARMADVIWRMLLAPFLPEYRLPALSDRAARRIYRALAFITTLGIAAVAVCEWMTMLGLPREIHVMMSLLGAGVIVFALIVLMRTHKRAITVAVLGGEDPATAGWLPRAGAAVWFPGMALFLAGTLADQTFRMVMGISGAEFALVVPFLALMGALGLYAVIVCVAERLLRRRRRMDMLNRAAEAEARTPEAADAAPGDEAAMAAPAPPGHGLRTYEDLARRAASLIALGTVAFLLLRYWGGPGIFEQTLLLRIVSEVVDIALIGYLVFHAIRIWIDQRIEEERGDEPEDGAILEGEGGGAGASRLATLLPLVRNAVLIVIASGATLGIAAELGANVAPLFAGAGIVGLAIGFGSQALVRDILSGVFFLIDDAFRRGEYIDVGEVKGTVEKISLRSFQLRHHLGMLHTIPFGEIQYLTNFSRDWVMMKLPLRLTYDTDVERVRKLIKKLGQELLEDETIGEKFLAPLKSQGVIHMEESAMIVRVKFMTRPGDQWVVRKRVYQEIRSLFEREGIKFAHREVVVRIPDLPERELSEDEQKMVGAAARRTLDVVDADRLKGTGTMGPLDDR